MVATDKWINYDREGIDRPQSGLDGGCNFEILHGGTDWINHDDGIGDVGHGMAHIGSIMRV